MRSNLARGSPDRPATDIDTVGIAAAPHSQERYVLLSRVHFGGAEPRVTG